MSGSAMHTSGSVVPLQTAVANGSPIHGQNLQYDDEQSEDEETTLSIIFKKGGNN